MPIMDEKDIGRLEARSNSDSTDPVQELPLDGGSQAWLVVAGSWCGLVCSFGWVNALGVFQDYYQANQLKDFSPSDISWILSLCPFVIFGAGLITGKLFDNYGARWLLVVGTFFHVFGLMMTSISSEYYQFILSQGVCSSLGASLIFYSVTSSTATWFKERRALAFGIISSGASMGGVIFPTILPKMFPELGFGWSVRVCAFIMLGLLTISIFTVRSRLAPQSRPVKLHDYYGPFKEPVFVLMTIASSSGFFAMFIPINYVILQAQTNGVRASLSSYLLAILNAASLFGRILPGYIADHVGRCNVMLVMCTLSACSILAVWLPGTLYAPSSEAVYIVFSLMYGFASGTFVSMIPPLVAQISPDISKIGTRQGVMYAFLAIASLCGSPIAGAIVNSQDGAYWGLQVFSGAMTVNAIIFFAACRYLLAGTSIRVKV